MIRNVFLSLLVLAASVFCHVEAAQAGSPTQTAVVLSGAQDAYPAATLALDFIGQASAGSPFYKAGGTIAGSCFTCVPGLAVTRASGGYAEDQTGALTWFNSGQARITNKGLLVEEARTNLFTNSSSLADFSRSNITDTTDGTLSLTGNLARKIAATATVSTSFNFSKVVAATTASGSIYGKKGSGATDANTFDLYNATTATDLVVFTINWDTGRVTYSIGSSGVVVTPGPNGWWRVSVSASSGITSGDTVRFYAGFTGNAETAGEYAYFADSQLEAGPFPSSYIPTTAASATRAADAITLTESWPTPAATFLVQTGPGYGSGNASNNGGYVAVFNGDPALSNILRFTAATQAISTAATTQLQYPSSLDRSKVTKAAISWSAGSRRETSNGYGIVSDANPIVATGALYLGSADGTSTNFYNGYIQVVLLYPQQLSDAVMQGWTSGVDLSAINLNFSAGSYRAVVNGNVVQSTSLANFATAAGYTLTVTRSSTGYSQDSAGNLVAFGTNVPRITDLGLLAEEARTNLLPRSQEFENASWLTGDGAFTANQATAPDGTATADLYVEGTTSNTLHGAFQANIPLSAGTSYGISAYVKPLGRIWMRAAFADSGAALSGSTWFNVQTCAVGSHTWNTGTFVLATATPVANGFCHIVVEGTTTASSTTGGQVRLVADTADGNTTYTGDGRAAFYIWQADLQAGAFISSPIVTTSAAATRPADVVTISGLSIPAPYTVLFDGSIGSQTGEIWTANTNANGVLLYYPTLPTSVVREASVSTASVSNGAVASNVRFQTATRFALNNVNAATNGALGVADTSSTPPTMTIFGFANGAYNFSGNNANPLIRGLVIYPYAANDNELQYRSAGNF